MAHIWQSFAPVDFDVLRRYQAELLVNATGYATAKKYELHEAQLKNRLKEWNMLDKFDVLDFQWVGRPQPNPTCQLASTTYLRIFAQAVEKDVIGKMMAAWATNVMQHFSGLYEPSNAIRAHAHIWQVCTAR